MGMKKISFKITGNQENNKGNPIPYFRVTAQSKWSKGTKRYHAWCDYVRAHYLDALGTLTKFDRADMGDMHDLLQKRPIASTGRKTHMALRITWANESHADADNIFKGIADALFMNDKELIGEFDAEHGDKGCAGAVMVTLTFY